MTRELLCGQKKQRATTTATKRIEQKPQPLPKWKSKRERAQKKNTRHQRH